MTKDEGIIWSNCAKIKKVVDIYGHIVYNSVYNNEDEIQIKSCIIIMQHIRRRQP